MNIQLYHKLIEHPELLNKDTLKDMEELVNNFPMVENFRILLALNLLILDDYRYTNALTNAAIFASDRKRLKEWVDYIIQSQEDFESEKEPESYEDSSINTLESQKKDIEEINSEDLNTADKSAEIQAEQTDEGKVEEPHTVDLSHSIIIDNEAEKEDLEAEKKNIRSKKELLKLVRKRLDEIEAEKTLKNENEIDERTSKAKLIDRFIEQEPRISRPDKNEFFDPQSEAIESSIEDDDFFITETLAIIHSQQGNLKKAEEIYRKLILKNPEKSSYFAAQIEKLTKK